MIDIADDLLRDMHNATQDAFNRAAGTDGWAMRDIPRLTPEFWEELLDSIGREHVRVMVFTHGNFRVATDESGTRTEPTEPWVRGTILISPEGMDALRASAEKEKPGA